MISLKNVSENNLKNISIDIPINKITTITGVSGSGKSTLIYNVIAKESQRRERIDSGKANFVDFATKPNFEEIKNLPYCISLKQRGLSKTISSTLATVTGLHEVLREEFIKSGEIVTPENNIVEKPTSTNILDFILKYYPSEKYQCFAIVCYKKKTDGDSELNFLRLNNIENAIFISSFDDKESLKKVSSLKQLNIKYKHTILIPILDIKTINNYEYLAKESFLLKIKDETFNFSIDYPDLKTGKIYQKPSSSLLSFNAISEFSGKCNYCDGYGIIDNIDSKNLINPNKKLNDFFINLEDNKKGCYKYIAICKDSLARTLKKSQIDVEKSFYELNEDEQNIILNILKTQMIKHQNRPTINRYIKKQVCKKCNGTRLNYKANAIKLFDKSISELLNFTVDDLFEFLRDKELQNKKILNILNALQNATLGYLELNRTTDTLSGGELQRVKIAIELNNCYKNLLYILDEPSNGLHPYNNYQIIELIKELKNKENSIIISEHNPLYLENSDFEIELGYGSGENGGEVVFKGKRVENNINLKNYRVKIKANLENSIYLVGVNINNIVHQDFVVPLNCLVVVSGVSGSGKSSFVHNALVPLIKEYISNKTINSNLAKDIKNFHLIKDVIELTQSQIGNNSRSIVATYLNIFDLIREIFASTQEAKKLNFDKSYFSFNLENGACNVCDGLGEINEDCCPSCAGAKYKSEVLTILYKDLNIYELLSLYIKKLDGFFDNPKIKFTLDLLSKLGLSHLNLGRSTPTLSGGEAQRLKLAKVLIDSYLKIEKGGYLFVLDEPTTGLGEKDVINLYSIFDEIISFKNSIIVIEHNQNVIKNSDFIIDVGLGSGKNGGKNIFSGAYEDLILYKNSITSKALNGEFQKIDKLFLEKNSLIIKEYDFNKRNYNFNKFYLDEKNFNLEKLFSNNYFVVCDDSNHLYFKTKNELFDFIYSLDIDKISFNPYVNELYKYKKVPLSIKKERLRNLKSLGFNIKQNDYLINEWDYKVYCKSIQEAYNFGNGWITIISNNKTIELFTRFISLKNQIVGSMKIDTKTFNLYYNSCPYCLGGAKINSYNLDFIIGDKSKSILDIGFLKINKKLNLKNIILKFKEEGLFDFIKPFCDLSDEEKNIFLYGFKEYEFLKKNGRVNAIGDFLRWEGLFNYLKKELEQIYLEQITCPFCVKGFKKEINFYSYKNKKIFDFID